MSDISTTPEKYTNSTFDIVLASNEGRHFRVHSYVLKAGSTFFCDMLTNPSIGTTTSGSEEDVIPIENATSADLELLLDFMHNAPVTVTADWDRYDRVMALCDHLGCEAVVDRILARLGTCIKKAPWRIFCIASHHNVLPLAKMALVSMYYDKLSSLSTARASQVSAAYLVGLMKAMVKYPSETARELKER